MLVYFPLFLVYKLQHSNISMWPIRESNISISIMLQSNVAYLQLVYVVVYLWLFNAKIWWNPTLPESSPAHQCAVLPVVAFIQLELL